MEPRLAEVDRIAFSPCGRYLAVGDWTGNAHVYDMLQGRWITNFGERNGVVGGLAFSRDGRLMALGTGPTMDSVSLRWDPPGLIRLVETYNWSGGIRIGHFDSCFADLVFCPSGSTLYASEEQSGVTAWSIAEAKYTRRFPKPTKHLPGDCRLALTPDGSALFFAGTLYSCETGELFLKLDGLPDFGGGCDISSDGRYVAVGSFSQPEAAIWLLQDGSRVLLFMEHGGPLSAVRFSPCGRLLATTEVTGNSVRTWCTRSGRSMREFASGLLVGVNDIAFTADGRFIAAGGKERNGPEGIVIVCDVNTGDVTHRLV